MWHNRNTDLTLVIHRDGKGNLASAEMNAIRMFQEGNQVVRDRLDIQRTQSAVLVTVDGVEYAIVSDDNNSFSDPYWRAMFEAPMFVQLSPFGPPTAIGGSASAKKVNVGGKLGIIQDPFGNAQYLGATLPLDGYGIRNLSVSDDGRVLLGQLYGKYSTPDPYHQQPHQSQAWDVEALITAALKHQDGLRKHIVLDPGTEQLIPTQTSAPAGTFFDGPTDEVHVDGNMGDVINVDLKKLLHDQHGLDINRMSGFLLSNQSRSDYSQTSADMRLVTTEFVNYAPGNDQIYSRAGINGDTADFSETGLFFMAPTLTDENIKTLRNGGDTASELPLRTQPRRL